MSLATAETLLRRALLDPSSPEAVAALTGAAAKLKRAGADLHKVPLIVAPVTFTPVTPFGQPREVDRLREENEQLKRKLARATRPKKDTRMKIDITPIIAAAEHHEAEAQRLRAALALLEPIAADAPPVRAKGFQDTPTLSPADVELVRAEIARGATLKGLAKRFNVSPTTIFNVKHRKGGYGS